jgi:putative phosphoesterase
MRIGIISDIHGNFTALQAALKDMERQAVDSIICLGDIATLGPQPREVVAKVKELGCPCIIGNHESALLDLENTLKYQIAADLVPALEWCMQQLDSSDLDFMRSFMPTLEVSIEDNIKLLYFHGSPASNTDQLLSTTPVEEMSEYLSGRQADIFIGGHTHIPMLRQHNGKLIVNPGSIGSAFHSAYQPGVPPSLLPWAEYAVMEIENGAVGIDLRRVPFDVEKHNRLIASRGVPIRAG